MRQIKIWFLALGGLAFSAGGCVMEGDEAMQLQDGGAPGHLEDEEAPEAQPGSEAAQSPGSNELRLAEPPGDLDPGANIEANVCYSNTRDFSLHRKPDIAVRIDVCVESAGKNRRAYVKGSWKGSLGFIGGKRFDSFRVHYRLEHRNRTIRIDDCDLTPRINNDYSGSFTCRKDTWYHHKSKKHWTGDGKAVYNIDGDGEGNKTWQLHGSPPIR